MFPESKVTPSFLTILVGKIEFPKSFVGNFWTRVSLASLSLMIMNYVFSGLSFSFTPSVHFGTQVRLSISSAKIESKFLWLFARYILVSSAYRWWVTLKLEGGGGG